MTGKYTVCEREVGKNGKGGWKKRSGKLRHREPYVNDTGDQNR